MNEIEQTIVQLAEKYKKPEEFIYTLEKLSIQRNEKGNFFLLVGNILHKFSYFVLALSSWNYALKHFIKDNDEVGESKCYTNLGAVYCDLADFKKAIKCQEKSLNIKMQIGDKAGESKCYMNLGNAYYGLGDFRKAIEYHEKSLEIVKEIGDKAGQSGCYGNLGLAYSRLGDFRKGIEYHERSLEIAKEIGDKAAQSRCYGNLSLAYCGLGDFRKAIEYQEKSLEIVKAIGDRAGQSKGYTNLGNAYCGLGDFGKAIEYHEKSLEIAKEIGDKAAQSACYTNLGNAHRNLGDFGKAIEYHEKSLEIVKEIGDKAGESKCYANLGGAYDGLGDFGRAIRYFERSLEIAKEIGDKATQSKCYANLGAAYVGLGDFRKAIEYHEKSLEIAKEIGDKAVQSACYTNLGNAHRNLGDFGKAIEYHEKSLEIVKEIGDKAGESKCYMNLGNAYYGLGDFRKAIKCHGKSLNIKMQIGDKAGESACYANIGNAYDSLGDFGKALGCHEKSLQIAKGIGDRAAESACYANIGAAYSGLGDFENAIRYFERSLEILKETGDKAVESKCYANLGAAYVGLGDFKKAMEFHEKSLEILKEIGDTDSERIVNLNLGRIYHESKPELAYNFCKHSIELSEKISVKLAEEEHKIWFYARVSDAYQHMIPLCLKLKKAKEAFEYTERSKSRAFLDLLAATEIKPTIELTSELKSWLDDEEKNLAKLREIQTRHLRQTRVSVEPGDVEKIFGNLNQVYDKIEEFDSEYVFTRRGKPLSLSKIRHMLSLQKRDVILIEYFITEDETFIFVVSSEDRELHIETVPISTEKLQRHIENYWREVVEFLYLKEIGDTWLSLSEYLIKPISKYLSKGDLVYFVPYGPLHYLPLHALELKGEPLIKLHPIAYSPSASLIKFCQSKGSNKLESCASFGVVFEEEANGVAELFNSKAHNGSLATKDNVLENCTDKDVIHFSCHGRFDYVDPLSSGVVLYNDEVLSAREIFDMRLNAELVTLSACETGLNQRSPGDELIGLTRAFIYAGVPSVVVSLWSVDARSTQELMLEFYKLLQNGVDKATALQKAQTKIMEKEEYSHPYYWAPFILVGDWK